MDFALRVEGWTGDPRRDKVIFYEFVKMTARINLHLMRYNNFPRLYESGIVYKSEPEEIEIFRDIPSVIKNGGSDCNNLTAWRLAEHIKSGVAADICIDWARKEDNSGWLYHIYLSLPHGKEDPSRYLGMK